MDADVNDDEGESYGKNANDEGCDFVSGDEQEEDALRNQERALEEIAAGSVRSRASRGQSQANEVLNSMPSERQQSERQSSAQYNNPGDLE